MLKDALVRLCNLAILNVVKFLGDPPLVLRAGGEPGYPAFGKSLEESVICQMIG